MIKFSLTYIFCQLTSLKDQQYLIEKLKLNVTQYHFCFFFKYESYNHNFFISKLIQKIFDCKKSNDRYRCNKKN